MTKTKITILVGFLGSGKTTLLKHIASLYQEERIAIVVNEFGQLNLDIKRLETHFKHSHEVTGGSIFCSCKSDQFIDTILALSKEDFSHIFVEGSGLANPSSLPHILKIIAKKTEDQVHYKGTIALVDPSNISKITKTLNAAKNQLTYADMILLNKVDLATEDQIKDAIKTISHFNHDAPIIPTLYSVIDKEKLERLQRLEHQANYKQTMDMHLQKVCLQLEHPSKEDLENLCQELTTKTDRIKGVYSSNQESFYTEYIDGKLHFEAIDFTGENYLILLSTHKDYLKASIEEVFKKSKHAFSVCSLS